MPANLDHLAISAGDRDLIRRLVPGATTIYLAALDKGLSGSLVWRAQWRVGGPMSKPHVIKVGPLQKIEREFEGFSEVASAIDPRCGFMKISRSKASGRGALRQEFAAGTAANGETLSLRQTIQAMREPSAAQTLVAALYRKRLAGWHFPGEPDFAAPKSVRLKTALDWWTRKVDLPKTISSIGATGMATSLHDRCGVDASKMGAAVKRVFSERTAAGFGPVHGDLHSQNVLVVGTNEPEVIDFGWTHRNKWRAVDFLMLECSLKFLATPPDALLDDLLDLERHLEPSLAGGTFDWDSLGDLVRGDELAVTGAAIEEVRRCALGSGAVVDADQYRLGLAGMTAGLASIREHINRVYLVHSLALHTRVILEGGAL